MSDELLLIQLHRQLSRAWGEETELSYSEFEYLSLVEIASAELPERPSAEHDDRTHLSALAAEMQVQKSSASLMVNKLEKRGLVQRVQCRYDARAQHILITATGQQLLARSRSRVYQPLLQALQRQLSTEQQQQWPALLQAMLQSWAEDEEPAPASED
ncbi:MarR family winged helix-turn-helix transcriptional regulator [Balneatrix alpica]|uniref:MarR family winged helix-turn-helix transcriptional regulator n=1 Tax=Balneatrix alpica TaxID=75684 RepID=UPI002739FAC7|nr:MarR family transcriptional regulator [Balneatrix alpica]